MKLRALGLALFASGFVACTGGGDDDGGDDNTNNTPQPRNVDPIAGGGTAGGSIDGVLTIFVLDEDDAPIADATVLVADGVDLSARTDAEGRVDFNDAALAKGVSVHIFKDGFEFSSAFGFDASVVTIVLDDGADVEPPMGQVGTVTGTITGWENLPANSATAARVAQISALGDDLADFMQAPRPGTATLMDPEGTPTNLVINGNDPFPMWTDYALRADTRAEKILAVSGLFDVPTQTFDITHIGIADAALTAGATVSANLALSNALDTELTITASNLPMLANDNALFAAELDGLLVPLSGGALDNGMRTGNGPALSGDFASARYVALLQFFSDDEVGDVAASTAFAIARGTDTSFTFDSVLSPPNAPTATGRMVGTSAVTGASVTIMDLRTAEDDKSLWNIVVFGGTDPTVALPAVPDGINDPLTGGRILEATVLDFGATNLNDVAFESLEEESLSSASTRAEVSF
ncbi:MAG: hypothetical protein RMA76_14740 [Deltaproteobacteria bacterium]|jgi:hypothetical protein